MKNSTMRLLVALATVFPGLAEARGGGGGGLLAWAFVWLGGIVLVWFWKATLPLAVSFGFLGAGLWGMAHSENTPKFIACALMAGIGGFFTLALFSRD